jgi:hypothetical protein
MILIEDNANESLERDSTSPSYGTSSFPSPSTPIKSYDREAREPSSPPEECCLGNSLIEFVRATFQVRARPPCLLACLPPTLRRPVSPGPAKLTNPHSRPIFNFCHPQSWQCEIFSLQPAVLFEPFYLDAALCLLQELARRRPDLPLRGSLDCLASYAAACMWLACKTCGVRSLTPNRALMCAGTRVHPEALSACEVDVCCSLDWEICGILRAADLLCPRE